MADFDMGPSIQHFFFLIFDGEELPQVYMEFSHFGYFWSFLAKKCHFWILAKKPNTKTILLVPKNLNLHNLKSDFQYLINRTEKRPFLGPFRQKMAPFEMWPIY